MGSIPGGRIIGLIEPAVAAPGTVDPSQESYKAEAEKVHGGFHDRQWREMMDQTTRLADQHVLESQARLRHIDELMARARATGPKAGPASELERLLAHIDEQRARLVRHLDELPRRPAGDVPALVERGKGLTGALELAGLQLERILGAVFP